MKLTVKHEYKYVITSYFPGEICKILVDYNTCLSTHPSTGLYDFIYDAVTNNDAQVGG